MNDCQRAFILRLEIVALLHDLGKFSQRFLEVGFKGGGDLGKIHTAEFLDSDQGLCLPRLLDDLNSELPEDFLKFPDDVEQFRHLGDLLRYHHDNKLVEFKDSTDYPMQLYLMIYADTIDSSSSKGGAAFKVNNEDERQAKFNSSFMKQNPDNAYLATPFGEKEGDLSLNNESIKDYSCKSKKFQQELSELLADFKYWKLDTLIEKRSLILQLFRVHCSKTLGETRLPTNDVTLWQHSYGTASIFKAMLVRHLLLGLSSASGNRKNNVIHYQEQMAILGVCWSEDDLVARSYRPREIIGRRLALDKAAQVLKGKMEVGHCLGNEIYRDRDGIYFLIPYFDIDGEPGGEGKIKGFTDEIDAVLNSEEFFGGECIWEVRRKKIGIQVLGLADVIHGRNVEIIARGPVKPLWIKKWKNRENSRPREICPRCVLRPVELTMVSAGSEADRDKICDKCKKLASGADTLRNTDELADSGAKSQRKRLIGTSRGPISALMTLNR